MHREAEAVVLCRYLTGETPAGEIIEKYTAAVDKFAVPLRTAEQKTWIRCIQHPKLLPFADAAWGWSDPVHPLRHRIYIMMATLEAHRSYQHFFLPVPRSGTYKFFIFFRLLRSGIRLIAGKVILWFL